MLLAAYKIHFKYQGDKFKIEGSMKNNIVVDGSYRRGSKK